MRDAFTHFEWKSIARFVGDVPSNARGLQRLMGYLGGRLAFYVALLIGLIVANAITAASDADVGRSDPPTVFESLMQVTFIFVAVLVVALPLDSLRFLMARDGKRKLESGTSMTASPSTAGRVGVSGTALTEGF